MCEKFERSRKDQSNSITVGVDLNEMKFFEDIFKNTYKEKISKKDMKSSAIHKFLLKKFKLKYKIISLKFVELPSTVFMQYSAQDSVSLKIPKIKTFKKINLTLIVFFEIFHPPLASTRENQILSEFTKCGSQE